MAGCIVLLSLLEVYYFLLTVSDITSCYGEHKGCCKDRIKTVVEETDNQMAGYERNKKDERVL